jgi:hypothetical protein
MVVTASGTLRRPFAGRMFTPAWVCAFLSTFALPWSGLPVSIYAGAGSWTFYLFAAGAAALREPDGLPACGERRAFAVLNVAAIVLAICIFMYKYGVPGDLPGIEGIAAINSLDGLSGPWLAASRIFFLLSCAASFLAVHSPDDRASALLSFSFM